MIWRIRIMVTMTDPTSNSISDEMSKSAIGVGAAIFTDILLLWAIFGSPPYSFFGFMRAILFITSVYFSVVLFRANRMLTPLSLGLLALSSFHVVSRMPRAQWIPFNWLAIGVISVSSLVLYKMEKRTCPVANDE